MDPSYNPENIPLTLTTMMSRCIEMPTATSQQDFVPKLRLANLGITEYAKSATYSCKTPSTVVELISRPAGISVINDTKFAKQSPALYARIPGAAMLSISASRKCNLTKRVVACLCAMSFKASSTFPLRVD